MQAVAEAPVMARASGYVKRRLADIGDSVQAGQLLAEIEAPEVDQQILQAVSGRDQAAAVLEQAHAGLRLSTSNQSIAKLTADRWRTLAGHGAVSRQENDNYQAQLEAQTANVQAAEKTILAAKSNLAAAEANLARLNQLKSYQQVRAPFAGIITVRNIETGTLIGEGSTLLYRVAQPGQLRVYVNVPQPDADAIRPGMPATLSLQGSADPPWKATVTRTAKAFDPTSRTMLTEVQVTNPASKLLPGMFVMVGLRISRNSTTLLIPGDTLVVRSEGPQVAVVDKSGCVHYHKVALGRDLGPKLQVLSGVEEGDRIVVNPGDTAKEGKKVRPILARGAAS
jgi:RND family efflux transporter MFP subunit